MPESAGSGGWRPPRAFIIVAAAMEIIGLALATILWVESSVYSRTTDPLQFPSPPLIRVRLGRSAQHSDQQVGVARHGSAWASEGLVSVPTF